MALAFCHGLQKQDINVMRTQELLGEAIILLGEGENGHGFNST